MRLYFLLRFPASMSAWPADREQKYTMDARNIRIGESGLDELVQRLRQQGQPQTLEALTEQYLLILKRLIGVEEGS